MDSPGRNSNSVIPESSLMDDFSKRKIMKQRTRPSLLLYSLDRTRKRETSLALGCQRSEETNSQNLSWRNSHFLSEHWNPKKDLDTDLLQDIHISSVKSKMSGHFSDVPEDLDSQPIDLSKKKTDPPVQTHDVDKKEPLCLKVTGEKSQDEPAVTALAKEEQDTTHLEHKNKKAAEEGVGLLGGRECFSDQTAARETESSHKKEGLSIMKLYRSERSNGNSLVMEVDLVGESEVKLVGESPLNGLGESCLQSTVSSNTPYCTSENSSKDRSCYSDYLLSSSEDSAGPCQDSTSKTEDKESKGYLLIDDKGIPYIFTGDHASSEYLGTAGTASVTGASRGFLSLHVHDEGYTLSKRKRSIPATAMSEKTLNALKAGQSGSVAVVTHSSDLRDGEVLGTMASKEDQDISSVLSSASTSTYTLTFPSTGVTSPGKAAASNSAPKRVLYCQVCFRAFFYLSDLERHSITHSEHKPYVCGECGKRFKRSSHLERHKHIHTGQRNYACAICGKRFREAGELMRHQRVHTGEKPYQCEDCHMRFAERNTLRRHIKRKHAREGLFSDEPQGEMLMRASGDLSDSKLGWYSGSSAVPGECSEGEDNEEMASVSKDEETLKKEEEDTVL
ncbi:zinc finger and BTB domain-containing protein 18 [Polypterus senegalus]|nr:zinc finger and BTB domain-containing protein 18 [Polypterus senegalus]XP_039597618.1 zinc finger and BTB domain-containing protein 18 [Polypterus senegalus]XP_039597619.1 zinc finger and BTB domain-containing protein 18 [Polypterus senegalus]